MKIAMPALGPTLESPLAERLSRAPYILILNTGAGQMEVIENSENLYLREDAGHRTARELCANRIHYLLAKHVGPKAYQVLHEADIKVGIVASDSCIEALNDFWDENFLPMHGAHAHPASKWGAWNPPVKITTEHKGEKG